MKTIKTIRPFFSELQHLDENGIALYVEALHLDRLSTLPEEILLHVEECDECKLQIVEISDLVQENNANGAIDVHPTLRKRQRSYYPYRIAAVFIISALLGTLYYLTADYTDSERTLQSVPNDPLHTEQKPQVQSPTNELIADAYSPSVNLDDLVHEEYRSAAIEVISPEIGAFVQSPISFQWRHSEKPLKIKILTNREVTVLTSITQKNSFTTAKIFPPGLYYWKLETDDELLFVGKFFVK